jgi:hypothetical protein
MMIIVQLDDDVMRSRNGLSAGDHTAYDAAEAIFVRSLGLAKRHGAKAARRRCGAAQESGYCWT